MWVCVHMGVFAHMGMCICICMCLCVCVIARLENSFIWIQLLFMWWKNGEWPNITLVCLSIFLWTDSRCVSRVCQDIWENLIPDGSRSSSLHGQRITSMLQSSSVSSVLIHMGNVRTYVINHTHPGYQPATSPSCMVNALMSDITCKLFNQNDCVKQQ